ncbi:MAG: DUF4173 domain-containing protein [Ruminococcus sp.]|nr:DUF4173 domain-containing protein [Ruminococcus sp.]
MDTNNAPFTKSENYENISVNPYATGYSTYASSPKKPPREFSVKETIFAWISFVLAYLFCLSIPIADNPLGALVVIVLMFVSTACAVLIKGKKLKIMPVLVAISALVVSTSLIITANGFLHFFAFTYSLAAYCYFLYAISSDNIFRFTDSIVIDFFKAIFILPFCSFPAMFIAMFSGKKNKSGKIILKILIGVGVALIPCTVILALLSYDSSFTDLLKRVFDFEAKDIFTHIVSIFFGFPVGAYVYGLFVSSSDNKCKDVVTADSCNKILPKIRIAPVITVLTAVVPILAIYVFFFVSQWQYYISGFTGVLPKNFSHAQYAREGFFQLCTVSVINLLILVAISLLLKRKEDKKSILLKVISVVFSLFTLVLISTAIAKMVMYIEQYGLTPKRVYASWFMIVLAVVFLLIILKQFIKKLKLIVISLTVLVVMFAALSLSGVDTFIAHYNVDRYLDKTLDTVDIDAMEDLGDAAIPQLTRLANILDEKNDTDVMEVEYDYKLEYVEEYEYEDDKPSDYEIMYYKLAMCLQDRVYHIDGTYEKSDPTIWEFNIPRYEAERTLIDAGYVEFEKE